MKICMILEGSYPFVFGGVSSWTHQYIQAMSEHVFVLWCIGAESRDRNHFKYELPDNVVEVRQIFLDEALCMEPSAKKVRLSDRELQELNNMISGEETDWDVLFELFQNKKENPVSMLMSEQFLDVIQKVCMEKYPYVSFADFFHTVRSMLLPVLYLMTGKVPEADLYHATATGYSGILGSLGKWKYGRPYILTEHGIYTREREEELLRAKWVVPEFRKQWIGLFYNFSRCAYAHADKVTSLYEAAGRMQEDLGCDERKLCVIGNGVHYDNFCHIPPKTDQECICIGAVVRIARIKDIKTMIYAFADLKMRMADREVQLFILGDVDDPEYKDECVSLIEMLQVEDIFFTGPVDVAEYMKTFDFTILTSISEAQPLSVLESFAAARPVVATDVGCCRELIFGKRDDMLGQAGLLVPPMHSVELANAMERMCREELLRKRMGQIGQKRVETFYTHEISVNRYRNLYREQFDGKGDVAWQELDLN